MYSTLEAQRNAKTPTYTENIELYSASAGKQLINKKLDLARFKIFMGDLSTAGAEADNPLFKL